MNYFKQLGHFVNNIYFFIFLFFCFLVFLFSCFPRQSSATTISPLIFEIELNPGEIKEEVIELFNEGNQDLYLSGSIEVFEPKGEVGETKILPPNVANQAVSWVKLPLNSLALAPGETAFAPVIISAPKTADVGGYYLAIMWESAAGSKTAGSQISIASRVGVLILLKIKGEVKEKLDIAEFFVQNKAGKKNIFFSHLPIDFASRLNNSGNVHIKPTGMVIIKNMFGRVSDDEAFNADGRNILPQSVRRFENRWQKGEYSAKPGFFANLIAECRQFAIGRFTAQLQLEYGENRTRIYSQLAVFWVIPWRLITVGLIFILAVLTIKILKLNSKKDDNNEIKSVLEKNRFDL